MDCCWIEGDLENGRHVFPDANYFQYENLSWADIFEMFFDNEIIEYLVEETQKYAIFLNQPDPKITAAEIKCFLAIHPGPAKKSTSRTLLPAVRFDGMHHYVAPCRRRYAGTDCKSFGRTMCTKCDVGLCVPCFAKYHTN